MALVISKLHILNMAIVIKAFKRRDLIETKKLSSPISTRLIDRTKVPGFPAAMILVGFLKPHLNPTFSSQLLSSLY